MKTDELKGSLGSNPSASAISKFPIGKFQPIFARIDENITDRELFLFWGLTFSSKSSRVVILIDEVCDAYSW